MFTIPDNLAAFSVAGLEDLRKIAKEELLAFKASVADAELATNEELARVKELHAFGLRVKAEIQARRDKAAEFAAASETDLDLPEPAATFATDTEPVADETVEPETVTASTAVATRTITVADIVQVSPSTTLEGIGGRDEWIPNHSLVAASGLPNIDGGTELGSWEDFAKAFISRSRSYSGGVRQQHAIATLERHYPAELTITEGMGHEAQQKIMEFAASESRLEGGSLIAANGWCAPSENLLTTCLQISTDGLWQGPEVVARRGGINHNQGIEFDSIFGTGTGFNILTEAQVIADTPKTCVEIPCPPFVDDRLDVSVLCLTGSILQNRAYPEFVSTFVQGALATFAHFVNRSIVAQIVAGSTAVNLTTVDPWVSDGTVVSQVLGAVELAITDIKYRLRMSMGSTVEIVLPFWLRALFRQDFSRRTGFNGVSLADAAIQAWFAERDARVQWVYDWQDAFSGVATGPGADTPILTLPALTATPTLQFLAYPAGTWVLGRLDVIRLESIYDSINTTQNLVTQLFMEDGFKPMRMCPLSRVYTVNLCPTGETSALQTVACADVTP